MFGVLDLFDLAARFHVIHFDVVFLFASCCWRVAVGESIFVHCEIHTGHEVYICFNNRWFRCFAGHRGSMAMPSRQGHGEYTFQSIRGGQLCISNSLDPGTMVDFRDIMQRSHKEGRQRL